MKKPKYIRNFRMTKYGNKISLGDFPEEEGCVSLVHENNDVNKTELNFLAPHGMKLTMAGSKPVYLLDDGLRSPYVKDECLYYIGPDITLNINRETGEDGEFLISWKTRDGLPLYIILHNNARGKAIIIFKGKEFNDERNVVCRIHFKPESIITTLEQGKEVMCIRKGVVCIPRIFMPGFYREV